MTESWTVCPRCGQTSIGVERLTLKALLAPDGLRRGVPAAPRFCATAECPIVYFDTAADVTFTEADLIVRVYAKHPADDDVSVCYCFEVTRGAMRTGATATREMVAREVQAGHCACEVKNPKGGCCLGDLVRIERAVMHGDEHPAADVALPAPRCCSA